MRNIQKLLDEDVFKCKFNVNFLLPLLYSMPIRKLSTEHAEVGKRMSGERAGSCIAMHERDQGGGGGRERWRSS